MTQIKQITMQDYSGLLYAGVVFTTINVGDYRIEEVVADGNQYMFFVDLEGETVYLVDNEETRRAIQSHGVSADTIKNMIDQAE